MYQNVTLKPNQQKPLHHEWKGQLHLQLLGLRDEQLVRLFSFFNKVSEKEIDQPGVELIMPGVEPTNQFYS